MLISDIKRTCENCDGNGFKAGFEECGSIQINLKKSCPFCSGRGYNLTEFGENLWELFMPMFKDMVNDEIYKKTNVLNQNIECNSKKLVSSRK